MSPQPLILSPSDDANATALHWALTRAGYQPVWPKSGSLADMEIGSVTVETDGRSGWRGGEGLGNRRFSAIWHRWPRRVSQLQGLAASDQDFACREWNCLQDNVFALERDLLDGLWVNTPANAVRGENKLVQLQEAVRCGLSVPETLISNQPDAIHAFVRQQGRTIYKPFRSHRWTNSNSGMIYHTPAALIADAEILSGANLSACPGIYQRFVEKRCDLRVTMIGDRFFGACITSRAAGAFVDWRPACTGNSSDLRAQVWSPSAVLQEQLRALMRKLGLVYGAIDLVVDQNDQVWFLEVNQVGQFLFVEEWLPELPLLHAMSSMLGQGRTDYCMDAQPRLRLSDFEHSDEGEAVRSRMIAERRAGSRPVSKRSSVEDA